MLQPGPRTLNTGAASSLIKELKQASISIMGLREVCRPGIGMTKFGGYAVIWPGPDEGAVLQEEWLGAGPLDNLTIKALLP